jgi:tRNA(fMet)-specific endonuclease VapC
VIKYLIDANIAVHSMDVGNDVLKARIAGSDAGSLAISVISYAEVTYGTYVGKAPPPTVLEAFIQAIPLVPFDENAARKYAELPFKRARFDRLLAAHALSIGATVVTNNEADFADVPGLMTENWTV